MAAAHDKAGGLHDLAADFIKAACAEVRHIDRVNQLQFCPQLFKAGKEHPSVLGNHSLIPAALVHLSASLDKHRKQITLAVGVNLFHIIGQPRVHAAAAHIRRVRHNRIIPLCQCFCHLYQRKQFSQCYFTGHIYIFCNLNKTVIQS